MKTSEKQELKRKIKILGLFLGIVFVPALVICTLLAVAKVPQWLNILVMVVILFILFFLFAWVCDKIEKKKTERKSKKKDPFSD
ncbi:MAG: hypothetical protein E7375_00555 [Clostridiales bacterium]|nr:hypothetical protein [Clostridiales bacterium]